MMEILKPFDQIDSQSRQIVGGKTWALACLARHGLPVPKGLCVTVDAYRRYITFNKLDGRISIELGRKDLMWKIIQRAQKLHSGSNDYYFCPKTYCFPDEYRKFMLDREASGNKHMYIMKPSASSCGKGIKIIGPKTQVQKKSGYVMC